MERPPQAAPLPAAKTPPRSSRAPGNRRQAAAAATEPAGDSQVRATWQLAHESHVSLIGARLCGIFRERKWSSFRATNWLAQQTGSRPAAAAHPHHHLHLHQHHSHSHQTPPDRTSGRAAESGSDESGATWRPPAWGAVSGEPSSYEFGASPAPDNTFREQPVGQQMIDRRAASVERVRHAGEQEQAAAESHKDAPEAPTELQMNGGQPAEQVAAPHQSQDQQQQQQQAQDPAQRLNQASQLGAVNEPAAECRCHACVSSLWPARLRIVGPVTMRRSCRRSEELKVVRTCCGDLATSQQAAARAPPAHLAAGRPDNSRSMSLTGAACPPIVLVGGSRLFSPASAWPGSGPREPPPRCKANSISSCIEPASAVQSRQQLRLLVYGTKNRCLVCELGARRKQAAAAAAAGAGCEPRKSLGAASPPAAGKRDYLKPSDCFAAQTPARTPKRRHSWICSLDTAANNSGSSTAVADPTTSYTAADPALTQHHQQAPKLHQPANSLAGSPSAGLVLRDTQRRESFLYRASESEFEISPKSVSRHSSIGSECHGDEPIVTPFAQILASLRNVGHNLLHLFNLPTPVLRERDTRRPSSSLHAAPIPPPPPPIQQAVGGGGGGAQSPQPQTAGQPPRQTFSQLLDDNLYEETINRLKLDTLEEHYWCLSQLEAIRSHKSMGDLALSKFSRMLDKELSHVPESKSGKQISGYLRSFLDKQPEELDLSYLTTTTAPSNQQKADLNPQRLHQQLAQVLLAGGDQHQVPLAVRADQPGPCKSPSDLLSSMSLSDGAPMRQAGPNKQLLVGRVSATIRQPERMQQLERLLNQTDSFEELPTYGVECSNQEQLDSLMKQIDVWGLNIFEVHQCSQEHSLTVVMYRIFQKRNLMNTFNISSTSLVKYMLTLEAHYLNVPYHNSMHAADVSQSVHVLLLSPALESVFSDLEIMTALFAAAIHDVDHPGVTNQYLIDSGSELALMYNDESVLENHSLAVAFKLLQEEGCDFLSNLSKKNRQTLRRMAIDMVLATDMSKHMSLLADFKTMVETKKVAGDGILLLDQYTERIQVLQNMLHCADLSNPTKHLDIYRQWVDRVMDEFHQQGDNERNQNLQISPMCDRLNANVEQSQVYFIDFIVHPLWETWAELVQPDAQAILENLQVNREWFNGQLQPDSPAAESQYDLDQADGAEPPEGHQGYLDSQESSAGVVLHPDMNSPDEQVAASCGCGVSRRTSDEPREQAKTEQPDSKVQIRLEEAGNK